MSFDVTLTLSTGNNKGKAVTLKEEKAGFINSVIATDNGKISETEYNKFLAMAKGAGNNLNVLETKELPEYLQGFAKKNYFEHYDIKRSNDNKYLEITVKKTPWYYPDPKIVTVAEDFGITEKELVRNNRDLIKDYPINDGHAIMYGETKVKGNTKVIIPFDDVNSNNGPSGAMKRLSTGAKDRVNTGIYNNFEEFFVDNFLR